MDFKIGKSRFENNLILAPMLGVSCNAFRLLCKRHGAGLVYTAMIHPDSIFHSNKFHSDKNDNTNNTYKGDIIREESPIAAQIVGKDAEKMAEAASILEEKVNIIDINLGCPDKDVLAQQAGAFLIKHPEQITKIVSGVISAVNCPVTAKIRIGWDDKTINAVEVSRQLEDLGIDAIIVHGRTRKQAYTGKANWDVIKQVKEAVEIPVIANGDVFSHEHYKAMLEKTNADFVMIGRGAIGNPQIFENCLRYSKGQEIIKKDLALAYNLFLEFADYYKRYSIRHHFSEIKQHAMWMVKGIRNGNVLKNKLSKAGNEEEILQILKVNQ